jgi:hypothetical protein
MTSEKITRVRAGDIDLVSKAAYFARVPLCTAVHPETRSECTRSAGHDESHPGHAGSDHVATGINFVAQEVWSA